MHMSSITIRTGEASDLHHAHRLVRELAIYEHSEEAFTATLDTYHQDFKAGVFEFLVAETNDHVVGMCLYYLTFSTWKGKMLYLEDFVVEEAFRRNGVGQLLWDQLKNVARDKECQLIKWQVLDWNEPAISFYEKNDAIIEKEWWNGKLFLLQ